MDSKRFANTASGLIGFLAPTYFAWTVYAEHIPQSIATWVMITLNNMIGVTLVYKSGNRQPWLQLGWLGSSALVVCAIVAGHNPLHWGWIETASCICCAMAVAIWLALGPRAALVGYLAAVLVSSVPMMVDFWHVPQPGSAWLFVSTVVSCLLAAYGAKKQDIAHLFVPIFMLVLNLSIVALCLR